MIRLDRLVTIGIVQPLLSGIDRSESKHRVLPILMYHSISDDVESDISAYYRTVTSPSRFIEQMQFLHSGGWRGVNLTDGFNALKASDARCSGSQKLFVLTFDDGFRDFYTT